MFSAVILVPGSIDSFPDTAIFIGHALLFGGELGSLQVIAPVEVRVKSPFTVKVPFAAPSSSSAEPSRLAKAAGELIVVLWARTGIKEAAKSKTNKKIPKK